MFALDGKTASFGLLSDFYFFEAVDNEFSQTYPLKLKKSKFIIYLQPIATLVIVNYPAI